MSEPLSEETLEEIRHALAAVRADMDAWYKTHPDPRWRREHPFDHDNMVTNTHVYITLPALLAELDRLRAQLAAFRPIVKKVAQTGEDPFGKISEAGPYTYKCPFCFRNIGDFTDQWDANAGRHSKTCVVLASRAALGQETSE